eukprot:10681064-Alexandrium_andersonii.AAC.1
MKPVASQRAKLTTGESEAAKAMIRQSRPEAKLLSRQTLCQPAAELNNAEGSEDRGGWKSSWQAPCP